MKKLMLSLFLLFVVSSTSSALSGGPGGVIYWNTQNGSIVNYGLYKVGIDETFASVGSPVNFDNIPFLDQTYAWNIQQRLRNVEVYDPRDQGGQGRLLVSSAYNNEPVWTGSNYQTPHDILIVDPDCNNAAYSVANGNMLSDGRKYVYNQWSTMDIIRALPAPQDWVLPTHGLSALLVGGSNASCRMYAVYDTNSSGVIDNVTTEGSLAYDATDIMDVEFNDDRILFTSMAGYHQPFNIMRTYTGPGGGNPTSSVFFNLGTYYSPDPNNALNPIKTATDGFGIAVGPSSMGSIVYVQGLDNITNNLCIWALKDGDADNKVDILNANDIIYKIWERGDYGINVANNAYGGEDLEFYINPDNGAMTLFANSYYGDLFALELTDNGMGTVDGMMVISGTGPYGYKNGFELDMNPIESSEIPEPTSMLLVGTAAAGALGVIRRRRMR